MQDEEVAQIVDRCEAQLLAARQAIDETLSALGNFKGQVNAFEMIMSRTREALLVNTSSPFAGMVGDAVQQWTPKSHHHLLSYSREHAEFTVGTRRLKVTQMEERILDHLWASSQAPLSREWLAVTLSLKPGTVDVLVSNLRKKLGLLSDGRSHIKSVRGQGWMLRGELCSFPPEVSAASLPGSRSKSA